MGRGIRLTLGLQVAALDKRARVREWSAAAGSKNGGARGQSRNATQSLSFSDRGAVGAQFSHSGFAGFLRCRVFCIEIRFIYTA